MFDNSSDTYPAEAMQVKAINPSLKDRLNYAVVEAEKKLADAKRAREILDMHPELEELINIMNRTRF